MGGFGSGRNWGCGKATVENSLTLDINKLVRNGNIRPGQWCSGSLRWRRVSTGDEIASIRYEANLNDSLEPWMCLRFRLRGELQNQRITLETTRPNYGGRRWWFRCPATEDRVAKLYIPPGGNIFAGRRAYGLAYESQRERDYERALSRAQNLRMKVGGDPSLAGPFPDKPRGMWWRTYWRLRKEAEDAELRNLAGVMKRYGLFEYFPER